MQFSKYVWVVGVFVVFMSIVSFAHPQSAIGANVADVIQRIPTALYRNINSAVDAVSLAGMYSVAQIAGGTSNQAVDVPRAAESLQSSVPQGELIVIPHVNAQKSAGYDNLFHWSYPIDGQFLTLNNNQMSASAISNPQRVIAISRIVSRIDYARVNYVTRDDILCDTALASGQTVFAVASPTTCSTPLQVKNIATVPYSADQAYLLLGDGRVRDAYLRRTDLPTDAVKIVHTNTCAIAIRANGQSVLLNDTSVPYGEPSDMRLQGSDSDCASLHPLMQNRFINDITYVDTLDEIPNLFRNPDLINSKTKNQHDNRSPINTHFSNDKIIVNWHEAYQEL